ncbi:MAG TPA: PAS domain S-box protein [Candidatus Angelobacter sp.]
MADAPPTGARDTQLFYDAFHASPIGIAVENLEGQPLFVNPAFCSMLGFSEEEMRNKHCVDFSPAEDAERDWLLFQQLRAGLIDHYQLDKRYFRRDGSLVWGRLSVSLLNSRPSPLVIAMVEDITDRKRAEEALRASEERVRLAQQAAHIGTFEWNLRTGVNTWTPELEAMYGLPPGGFSGTQTVFENLIHPEDRARVMDLIHGSLNTRQSTSGEWRVIWADGSIHWIAGHWQIVMDDSGEPLRMVGVNIDVTERKLSEEKLREYERAVEGAEEMIAVVDRDSRYLIANRKFLAMRNMTIEQVVGRSAGEVVHPEVFEAIVRKKLDQCFQGKVVRYELKYKYPDLGERDLLVSYFPIEGANGIDRVACIFQDITDRKQAEEALASMSRKLIEAQEQERTRIARELHDDITQRLALLAVEMDASRQNPPASIQDMSRLLTDLRDRIAEVSSQVQSISHQLHSSQLEYLGIVAAMRSFCREIAAAQKVEIDFTHDRIPEHVTHDTALCLFRVLQEALHNALKHSNVRHFEVRLTYADNQLYLTVADRGTGFDIESATNRAGLGLISMQERVRLAKGTIAIESKPMGGTTIHVRVPINAGRFSEQKAS